MIAWLSWLACLRPECSPARYAEPECRVMAEHDLARVRTADGVEVRFQDPGATGVESWAALGRVRVDADGGVRARVAGLGGFRISVHPGPADEGALRLAVENVHPRTPPLAHELERQGLTRRLAVPLDGGVVEITGDLPPGFCDDGYTVAALGDIQTNPVQFQRIVDALHEEAAFADAAGKPLAGLVLLGDLSEHSTREELENVDRILRNAPVPTAAIPGNHDVYDVIDALYNETFGPGNYAFDVCTARFVLLDTGSGGLAHSVVGRLPELLDSDADFLLSATHHPPFAAQATIGWTREDQAQLLMAELAARGADAMLAGHAHRRFLHESPPVPQLVVGTGGAIQYAVDPDYGYLRIQFDERMEPCFVPVPAPGSLNPIKPGDPETCAELPAPFD